MKNIPLDKISSNYKPACYHCGKEIEKEDFMYAPVMDNPKEQKYPLRASFHKDCYEEEIG